jgi:diguanylate cyclase (GGDEF)-like protein/PAS domain S-box-containing protein
MTTSPQAVRVAAPDGDGDATPLVAGEDLRAENESLRRENARLTQLVQMWTEERLSIQALIDWVPDYLWIKDANSRFLIINKALASDHGFDEPAKMLGMSDFDLHAAEVAKGFRSIEQGILASGHPMVDKEEMIVSHTGVRRWLSSTKMPLRNARKEVVGILGISRDITARKMADGLREGQREILEVIAMNAPLGDVLSQLVRQVETQLTNDFGAIFLFEREDGRLRCGAASGRLARGYIQAVTRIPVGPNAGSCGAAAYRREQVIVADILEDPLWNVLRGFVAPDGFRACWCAPILSHRGDVLGVFAMHSTEARKPTLIERQVIEITTRVAGIAIERAQAEDRIHFMATHDSLTGLPNRSLLHDRLTQAMLYAKRYDRWVTILFVDLDNFKLVNDSLGHNAGDELLRIIAARMVGCVRATDTVVRLGGDEFVVVLFDQPKSVELIATTFQKLRSSIAEPIMLAGHPLQITGSIGIANYPEDGTDPDTLLANADAAMYRAKEIGRDNFQFYTPDLNTRAHEKFLLIEELRLAIVRSEFVLHYQPQVDLRTGRIFAVEALIRWNHPRLGLVAPMKFVPLAEETGLIVPIGDWVLQTACRQCKAWQDAGLPHLNMSVNVSARQFRDKSWIARVVAALAETGLQAQYLELEITESLVMQHLEQAVATMKELQALGVQLAIDDFGTGYSSLNALKNFPIARLKIDKSFICDLPSNESDKAVASAVISLGQKLNLRVIAEGVETDAQIAFLRQSNCDEMQGYHFSRPIAADAMEALLHKAANA